MVLVEGMKKRREGELEGRRKGRRKERRRNLDLICRQVGRGRYTE